MADLIEVPFEGGSIVFAAAGTAGPRAYTTTTAIDKAAQTLEDAMSTVKAMATSMASHLAGIPCEGAEATFGLSITAKGKFIVAEASTEASIAIRLTFKK